MQKIYHFVSCFLHQLYFKFPHLFNILKFLHNSFYHLTVKCVWDKISPWIFFSSSPVSSKMSSIFLFPRTPLLIFILHYKVFVYFLISILLVPVSRLKFLFQSLLYCFMRPSILIFYLFFPTSFSLNNY